MKVVLYLSALIITLNACKGKKTGSEVNIPLPPNVVEKVEERFEPKENEKIGSPKKAIYLDTITDLKVSEKFFYEDKKIYMEYAFDKGVKNGPAMAFYENSNPWSLHNYKENVLHGAYKTWFENGQLRIEGQYDNGIKIGNWRFFDEKGNVIEEKNFSENPEQ